MRDRTAPGTVSLRVDPIRCEGVGSCAQLAPDLIHLDPWGFPVVERRALTAIEQEQALRAVQACPRRALVLDGFDGH